MWRGGMPMEWNPQADQATMRLWLRIATSLRAFLLLETKRLVDLSEWKNSSARFALSVSLFAMAVAAMVFASSRFYPGSEGSSDFIGWSAGSAVALAGLLIVPMLIGYRIFKLPRLSFAFNVVLLQQTLLAIGAVGSSLILMSQEPARTDFSLLREGQGKETLAYRRFCGDLEAASKLHLLGGRALARTAAVQRDIDETESWGNPDHASVVQAFRHMPRMKVHIQRRKRELRAALVDLKQYEAINEEREQVLTAFYDKYPTYSLAQEFFAAWLIACVGFALIHLWRALALGDRGDRSKVTTVAASVLTASIALGFVWWMSVTGELLSYRNMFVSPPATEFLQEDKPPINFAELKREAQQLRAEFAEVKKEHEKEGEELRGRYYRLRRSCPQTGAGTV